MTKFEKLCYFLPFQTRNDRIAKKAIALRIIGGALKGKKLLSFKGHKIRPTSDRVKESLFNIISERLEKGAAVLDLFAGSGNLGIEAMSRGAGRTCFVENDKKSLEILRKNIAHCGVSGSSEVIPLDARKGIAVLENRGDRFDIIFLDPPYGKGLLGETLGILGQSPVSDSALVVAECWSKEEVKDRYGILVRIDTRRYGDTSLNFFVRTSI